MQRAQVLLETWQVEALRATAERQRTSVSALLRRILTERLAPARRGEGAAVAAIEGIGADGASSGRDHDRWLYAPARRR